MRGSYQLVAEDGTRFEASIPEFTLSVPRVRAMACGPKQSCTADCD